MKKQQGSLQTRETRKFVGKTKGAVLHITEHQTTTGTFCLANPANSPIDATQLKLNPKTNNNNNNWNYNLPNEPKLIVCSNKLTIALIFIGQTAPIFVTQTRRQIIKNTFLIAAKKNTENNFRQIDLNGIRGSIQMITQSLRINNINNNSLSKRQHPPKR